MTRSLFLFVLFCFRSLFFFVLCILLSFFFLNLAHSQCSSSLFHSSLYHSLILFFLLPSSLCFYILSLSLSLFIGFVLVFFTRHFLSPLFPFIPYLEKPSSLLPLVHDRSQGPFSLPHYSWSCHDQFAQYGPGSERWENFNLTCTLGSRSRVSLEALFVYKRADNTFTKARGLNISELMVLGVKVHMALGGLGRG